MKGVSMENCNGVSFYKYTPHGAESRIVESRSIDNDQKNKRVNTDNHQIGLHVMILKAVGIDNPSLHPFVLNRHYNVVYWVDPDEELRTVMTEGVIPLWYEKGMIFLENPDDHEYLNVEVQRFNSTVDPGTSCGRVVVGRARIPLPNEFYRESRGSYTLVRTEGEEHKPEGHIVLAMRLERIKIDTPCI